MAPAASLTRKRFNGGARSTRPSPRSRSVAQRRAVVGEQAIEPIHHRGREGAVEAAPARVALERRRGADIEPEPRGLDNRLGERGNVAHADIEPLSRERMHDMRGVADQREPVGHEGARDLHVERKGLARTRQRNLAEAPAETLGELGEEARFVQQP